MIKIEVIELLSERFPQVLPQILEQAIGRAFNQIMYEVFRQDPSNFDLYAKPYVNVPVVKDPLTDIWYSLFPEQITQLPDHAEGVRRINRMKGKGMEFVPIQKDSIATFAELDVSRVDSTIGYSVGPDRVEYERNPNTDNVRMDLVIPFEKMDYEDPCYIPSGQDERLIEMVGNFIQGTPPENKINT